MQDGDFPRSTRRVGCASAHNPMSQDFERLIRSPYLKRAYRRWRAALLRQRDMPSVDGFAFNEDNLDDHVFIVAVEDDCFRVISAGKALTGQYGRNLAGTTILDDTMEMFGSRKASYRACVEKEAPVYEYFRHALGDENPALFERLILPFFDDRSRVSHLAGLVMVTNLEPTH